MTDEKYCAMLAAFVAIDLAEDYYRTLTIDEQAVFRRVAEQVNVRTTMLPNMDYIDVLGAMPRFVAWAEYDVYGFDMPAVFDLMRRYKQHHRVDTYRARSMIRQKAFF